MGDYLFPGLGNGGYDARHYTVRLRYPAGSPAQQVRGTVTMDVVASQDLSSLNLDFAGDAVTSVRVDRRPARFDWQRQAEELVITPARNLRRGHQFRVDVAFAAHPTAPAPGALDPVGWVATPHGSFTSFQPDTAHHALPVNDHPSDKATFRFELDVLRGSRRSPTVRRSEGATAAAARCGATRSVPRWRPSFFSSPSVTTSRSCRAAGWPVSPTAT